MKNNKYGEESFEYCAEKYYDDVYRFVFSIVYNKDWAPDIAQNTMEKAFKNWHSLRKRGSVKSWLLSIAKNETTSFLMKIYRQNDRDREYMEEIQEKFRESAVDEDILNILIYKENFAELAEVWEMLDDKYKRIMVLWTNGGYSEKEIAKMLNMNYNTVRVNLHRGIQKLKKLYAEIEKGGDMRNKQDNTLEREFKTRFSEFSEEYIKNSDIDIPPLDLSFMKEKPEKKRNFHRFSFAVSFCLIIFVVSSGMALWINSESAHALKFKAEKFYYKNFNGLYSTDDSADFSEDEIGITIERMEDMESAAAYFPQLVYPYYLPDGFELKKLDITKFSDGTVSSDYQFLDEDEREIIVGVFYNLPENSTNILTLEAEEIKLNDRTVYYMYDAYMDTSAVSFLLNDNSYNISGDVDKETLIKIASEINVYKGIDN